MKFLKLPQLYHNGGIHSIDVNQDNTILVSGGTDNKIGVWNLKKLIELSKLVLTHNSPEVRLKLKSLEPKQYITCHKSLINVVRFFKGDNKRFISSDVNGNVFFHTLHEQPETKQLFPFKSIETSEVNPVVDLTISADNRLIAWSTNNGKVYLYDVVKDTFQELTSICHEKPIIQRSIAFDPSNNYLITVGDDTQINVFQYLYEKDDTSTTTYKFRLIYKISKLFSQNPLNVRYKRISWSPDGNLVSIPTASKNQTMLISLISRSEKWTNIESLVGHDFACDVVKFNPKIFSSKENDTSKVHSVIASGGSDRTMAIWNTSKSTPITVLQDAVQGEILDITWTTDGTSLLFCTSQGKLCIGNFEPNELGYTFSQETMERFVQLQNNLIEPMNFRYPHEQTVGNRKQLPPIEFLSQKNAISTTTSLSNTVENDKKNAEDNVGVSNQSKSTTTTTTTTIKGGVITPEVIPPPKLQSLDDDIDGDGDDEEHKSGGMLDSVMNDRTQSSPRKLNKPKPIAPVVSDSTTQSLSFNKQKVTTKNGKRRIQPMLISSGNSAPSDLPRSNSVIKPVVNTTKSTMEFEKPSYSVSEEFYKQNKRPRTEETTGSNNNKKLKREMEPVKFIGSVILNPNTSFSKIRLATPKVRLFFQLKSKTDDDGVFILDIKNGSGNESKPSRLTYMKKDKEIWCDFIPKYIQLATEGSNFWAVTTVDGTILTYSHVSGKRLLPSIVLGSPISFLESYDKYLMVVTCIGELYVWDMEIKKNVLKSSISPLLELYNKEGLVKSDNITLCAVTSYGIPLVTLSNGSGYLFNKDLGVWQTITESWWCFGSHYWDSTQTGNSSGGGGGSGGSNNKQSLQTMNMFNDEQSIIELLEHKTNEEILRKTRTGRGKYFNKISKNMLMKEGFESLENTISISHLENRILCCELLGENKDFHKFFTTYVQRICELGFKAKLFEVCDELLGPIDTDTAKPPNENNWEPKICGFDKRELLKEIITSCSQFRDAQRVLVHFGKKIGVVIDES